MTAPIVIVTRGLPASGKSTWAKQWVGEDPKHRTRVNRDDLRFMLFGTPDYSNAQESIVTEVEKTAVTAALRAGRNVVVDATHLRPMYVRAWQRLARSYGATVTVNDFPIDVDEAIARDATRKEREQVGEDVIRRMARKYLPGGKFLKIVPERTGHAAVEEPYVIPEGGIPAVLVDIDGTIADHNGRNPHDLARCGRDLPRQNVIEAVRVAHATGLEVIYLSGRAEAVLDKQGNVITAVRPITQAWLDTHVQVPGALHMRPADDRREDFIVKRELFDAHVRHKYDVRWIFDDRQQVCDMWRALGLNCFQVAPGDF